MGQHRLNASPHIEDRNILLFLMDLNAASLNDLIKRAIQIWKECFLNHSRTRTALLIRSDKNTPHNFSKRDDGTTHKAFLKRIHERVSNQARPNASDVLDDHTPSESSAWTGTHDAELKFQLEKRRKREVEAQLRGHLLPEEQTLSLQASAHQELLRQDKSHADRVRSRSTYEAQKRKNKIK